MNKGLFDVEFSGIVEVRDRLLRLKEPLRLESGEPSFETPDHIKEAMTKALRDNQTHYAPSTGIKPLREAILKKLTSRNKINYVQSLEDIAVTNGGMHAMYCAFLTILNPGDEIIFPQPNWTASAWMINLAGVKVINVKLRPELDYRWDIEELESKITSRTKAILINSPHNPTGGLLTKADLTKLLEIAEKHDLYIVADEAYEDIVYEGEHHAIATLAGDFPQKVRDKIVSCFTFSKSYAMTGWRLGYTVCTNKQFADNVKKMILYTINGVSTPTQYAGAAALEGPQSFVHEMCRAYKERRDLLFEGVNQTEFLHCDRPPSGAFYLYAAITDKWERTAWELVNYLIDNYSLGSVPGDIFNDDNKAIRFSYACSTDMIKKAIRNLKKPAGVAA